MKGKIKLIARKTFALVLATAMSFPTGVLAAENEEKIYKADSSIMGLVEKDEPQKQIDLTNNNTNIRENENYLMETRATLDQSLSKINYRVRLLKKHEGISDNAHAKDLNLNLTPNPNSSINNIRLKSVSLPSQDGQNLDLGQDVETSEIGTDIKSLLVKIPNHDEIIMNFEADIRQAKDQRTYDLLMSLSDGDERLETTYNLISKKEIVRVDETETERLSLEKNTQSDTNNIKGQILDSGIFQILQSKDTILWTDYLVNDSGESRQVAYDFSLDNKQETDQTKINIDYYEPTDQGYILKKDFSQAIDFAKKIEFDLPADYIAKLSLKTRVDKKNTAVKSYSLNNKYIANPIYKEGSEEEKSDEESDPDGQEEKPADPKDKKSVDNKENPSEKPDQKPEEAEKSETNKKEEPAKEQSKESKPEISALALNRDALIADLKAKGELEEIKKSAIDELSSKLDLYNADKITWQDLAKSAKNLADVYHVDRLDFTSYLDNILSGLNKDTYKVAGINKEDLIKAAYPDQADNNTGLEEKVQDNIHDKEENKESSNLAKADKELKDALADNSKGIEEIQNLLTSLGEKYQLTRDEQAKLMTENDSAIRALVEKDRTENFRPNNFRVSNSFADKEFILKTQMTAIASPAWPIPAGYYFDVKLGPYLKKDPNIPLNDLYSGSRRIATASYIENGRDHYLRYTYITPVTTKTTLNINQSLAFDTNNIGTAQSVDIDIKVVPKNNPVQSMPRKTVRINDPSPVDTNFVVEDKGETQEGTYPYQLNWRTTSQKLKNRNGDDITSQIASDLNGAYIEWDIEVDTDKLVDPKNPLTFEKLNLTVFGSANQGLTNIYYKASKDKNDLGTTDGYLSSTNLGELLSQNSSVNKSDLGDKLYIKVKATIDPNQLHETYSIGFRINPDNNYIQKMLDDIIKKYNSIPVPPPLKWLKGVEDARRFAEVPFNLVETKIPATFLGLNDRFNNERFYYDNTRTIVAKRITDTRVDWYALDLIRRGETQDPSLDNPDFYRNKRNLETKNITTRKAYFVPLKDGGYRKTYQPGDVVLSNGQYYPGTIISYEYQNQRAGRNDTYYLSARLKEKKKFNVDASYDTEGGYVDLFTEKISDQALANGYLAYTENPYPIMRINRNFDMVSCFNDKIAAPVYQGKNGVFLDIHEDPTGEYLITRLNESIGNPNGEYRLTNYLQPNVTYDGINFNSGSKTQGQAMEELMKKIYFYGEEVKKEYANENDGKEMHRLIESSMFQRVIHHFTDNKSLADDYFQAPSDYNIDEWKVDYTLTGARKPTKELAWDGQFEGNLTARTHPSGVRKLKDNETRISHYPPVQKTQYEMARKLYAKVINSYKNGNNWDANKADSVKLVFYSHTDEGKYQELIAGRVMAPIEIDKYKKDGTKLEGAEFTFTNINTGKSKKWTSTNSPDAHKFYLRPGTYRVQETRTPAGYEKIKDFDIKVIREEINGDNGPYRFKKLPKIHVNDGFITKVELGDTLPKSADGTDLVKLDDNKIKVSITNIEDNLGKLEFTKKNRFTELYGAQFRLRKIKANSIEDAKAKLNKLAATDYDPAYDQTSKGNFAKFKFELIPVGFYVLEETIVPDGYEKAPLYLLEAEEQVVGNQKKVVLTFVGENIPETQSSPIIIRNKTKKTEIKFRKVRSEHVVDNDNEHLGLNDARFRLTSLRLVDGDYYQKEGYTSRTTPTSDPDDKVDGQNARGGGYITFDGLKVGEYLLQELQAPKGYAKTKLYGWKLVVSELQADDEKTGKKKGDLDYKLYEVPKESNLQDTNLNDVPLDNIINGRDKVEAFQIGNEARKISIPFDKYLSSGKEGADPEKANKKLVDENGNPLQFDLYKADYYGAILKDKNGEEIKVNKNPIVQNITKPGTGNPRVFTESKYDYSFELHDLEFGGYYVLREKNPPQGYKKASSILLKVEAEAIANEGFMKVIVRDPNPNAKTDDHSVFHGVIDFAKEAKLGEFSIKKVGYAINPYKGLVGLRRAYFRLYTADKNFEILYKDPGKKYPKEYIQKVTPGLPITKDDGKGNQVGRDPKDLPKDQGIVTFDQLKPGNYVLEEYRGPAGYEKDPGKWYITVDQFGTVKKYRDKPGTGTREVMHSFRSLRYNMSGLDVSEPIQFNNLMQAPTNPNLQQLAPYKVDTSNANIEVSAGAVDTTNGSRDITVKITPKTKQNASKRSHWVLLVDRSKDTSGKNNLDNNINKFITDLRAKADTPGAEVYLSIIEYSETKALNKVLLSKTNIKNLDDAQTYSYTMGTLSPTQFADQDNLDESSVNVRDYLSRVGIDRRNNNTKDGAFNLKPVVDASINNLTSENYDNKYVINFASFNSNNAERNYLNSDKFYQFETMWAFHLKGYKRVYTHLDQENSEIKGKASEYKNYIGGNSDLNGFYQTYPRRLRNKDRFPRASAFGPYVQKELLDGILNDKNNFEVQGSQESLLKKASLSIATNDKVKLESYSIKQNNNVLENQTNPSSSTIYKDNISLGVGESLELTYKISLKPEAEDNNIYNINRSMVYKSGITTDTDINLDPDAKLITYRQKEEQPPQVKTYTITTIANPVAGGSISLSQGPYKEGQTVTVTANPYEGYKLDTLTVKGTTTNKTVSITNNTFIMPAENVEVTATFIKEEIKPPLPQGDVTLRTIFTYSNQKNGEDDSTPPSGNAGKIKLLVKQKGTGMMPDEWVQVGPEQNAPYRGEINFTKLDRSREYRIEYTREESNASLWGTDTTSVIDIDLSNLKTDVYTLTISNGNLMEIFNKDETGFRIPLRITKVNENKGALTGSQFRARKILNGDKRLYEDILVNGKPSGKYKLSTEIAKDYPVYHDEKFDAVSEATGEPGDNYFRELTPGIYELTEVKAPDGTYRIPRDEDGNPMKWYFQVFVYKGRSARGADYMGINFNFEHTFKATDDFNKENVNDEEKAKLIGTTIEGLGSSNSKFNKYIEVIPDDGRSNPARPDAPYKGINDAQVTNYKNKTQFQFMKKDLDSHQNINGAVFSFRKVQTKQVEVAGKKVQQIQVDANNKPLYEKEQTKAEDGTELTEEQKDELRVQPFDKTDGFAKSTSNDRLGVEFKNISVGTYILEEIKPADGYKPIDAFWTVTFTEDKNGSWKQVVKGYEKQADGKYTEMSEPNNLFSKDAKTGNLVSIANKKNYIDLKFKKIKAKKENGQDVPVNTSAFRLTQVDEHGKPLANAKKWDVQSKFINNEYTFTKLGVGRYKLEETKAINEFEKPDPWFFNVVQDPKTNKLKIVFEKPKGFAYKSIEFTPDSEGNPKLDAEGNPEDLKVKNFSKIRFTFQKLKDETDENGAKLPLKNALFRLKKVRYSMQDNAKAYEYYDNDDDSLKKYSYGTKSTEFYETGIVKEYKINNKTYGFDEQGKLSTVDGNPASAADKKDIEDKKVKPDSVSSATGKYASRIRSQSDGAVSFDNLGEGIYELEEIIIPDGYKGSNKQFRWIFEVKKTENGLVIEHNPQTEKTYYEKFDKSYYNNTYSKYDFATNKNIEGGSGDFSYKITNTKTVTDLKWKKIRNRDNTNIIKSRTQFWMFKVSDNPNDFAAAETGSSSYAPYQIESSDGNFEIKDLSKGLYALVETIAPDGYKKMERTIVVQIYEDEKDGHKLKKKFYEMKREKVAGKDEYKNTVVKEPQSFTNLLTRKNNSETHVDNDGTFYINNESKPYFFYLSKGYMEKNVFTHITKGELKIKIYADPKDTTNKDKKVYEQTINLSEDKAYKINVDGVELGKDYILEEVESPDGFAKTKYKYRLRFAYDSSWTTPFVATLVAVLDEKGEPLKNSSGQNITETGKFIGGGLNIQNDKNSSNFQIINNKTEIVFTKYGKDGQKETPLKNVEFYLEKQAKDLNYYPLTKDMEPIKSKKGDDGKMYYYIERIVNGEIKEITFENTQVVTPEAFRKIYTSDEDGKFKITDLTDGYYRIIEPKAAKDADGNEYMKVNGPVKRFRVVGGEVKIFDKDKDSGKLVEKTVDKTNINILGKIINQKPGKGEFKITKLDQEGNPLDKIEYSLLNADSDQSESRSGITDANGNITFKDLPYGHYWLVETKTRDGYILDTKKKLISLGGGDWGKTPEPTRDISESITFDGRQPELESTAGTANTQVVYPNKAEGILAKFNFKINSTTVIKPGDYFTVNFSDKVDLDGIFRDNDGNGKMADSQLNIIGDAGVLAEAKINKDRRSITYTFTHYVDDYKPEKMSMFVQLFANRRLVDHKQDITVTAKIGKTTDTTDSRYNYSDDINVDYRGRGAGNSYNGYQNPKSDISSYMLRLNPEDKTFTAIIYYNPWNRYLTNKNISFSTDQDIIRNSLSVKTYRKSGWGSHSNGWQNGDLPDSYDVDFTKSLTYLGDGYQPAYGASTSTTTRKIYVDSDLLNGEDYNRHTYVVEIKGKLAGDDIKSLKTKAEYNSHNLYLENYYGYYYYYNSYRGYFETWSQFFNPGGLGDAKKEVSLVNFKNRIEFVKIDGGVLSNIVDKSETNNESLKDLGIGKVLKGAKFKLQRKTDTDTDYTDVSDSERESDENGIFSWEGLSKGNYQVIETQPASDKYKKPDNPISTFTVDENGNITNIKNDNQILENYKKAEITIMKTDQHGDALEGAEFFLAGEKKADGSNVDKEYKDLTRSTGRDGRVKFDNLPAGKYTLEEKTAPQGYTKIDQIWKLEVTRDGKVRWSNSFDDTNDQMKALANQSYQKDTDTNNIKSEILGIDTKTKTFRQKITIKAKPSELDKARLILEPPSADLKLTQVSTKVRLVQLDKATIKDKDTSSYTVEINGGANPNLTLRIIPPYRDNQPTNLQGQAGGQTQANDEAEREYQFIVDMPYKDDTEIGTKATYQVGTVNQKTGKVEYTNTDAKTVLDKYLSKGNYTITDTNVDMDSYTNKYLDRDINLITTDIANYKNPDIHFEKVDAADKGKKLGGAVFEIHKKQDDNTFKPIKKDGKPFIPSGSNISELWQATSAETTGKFSFLSIPDGEYKIIETKTPSGYALLKKEVYQFKVEKGKIYKYDDKSKEYVELTDDTVKSPIQIENRKAEYPNTGGPGVWIGYSLIGLIVMTLGVLIYNRRRNNLA